MLQQDDAAILRWAIPLFGFAVLPWLLAFLRTRPRVLLFAVIGAWLLLLLIPVRYTFFRFVTVCALMIPTVRSLQIVAGHERPGRYSDAVHLFSIPAVIRFETPFRPDPRRAATILLVTLTHLALIAGLWFVVARFRDLALLIVAAQLGCYLMLSVMTGVPTAVLTLRGVDHDPPFRRPLLARTPSEFWSYRWNTWVSRLMYRYAFIPAGGRRNPVRGTLAAFGLSGLVHEAIVGISAFRLTGLMLLYFLLQGVLVVVTSRSRAFRRLADQRPLVSSVLTMIVLLASGTIVVAAAGPLMRVH